MTGWGLFALAVLTLLAFFLLLMAAFENLRLQLKRIADALEKKRDG